MSAPDHQPRSVPGARRDPVATTLLIVAGIALLLPGLCSIGFIIILSGDGLKDLFSDGGLVALWAVCFAISAGGVALIRRAWIGRPTVE